jgi:DNA-damage-inducible protein J
MIHVRVDEDLKARASDTLEKMGLSLSDAVRLLLTRIAAEQALPFEVRVPNAETVASIKEGEQGDVLRASNMAEMMALLNADD